MTRPLAALGLATGCLAALLIFCLWAPGALAALGFPLDDAWIHAVYARELARTGMLSYNPGVPANGMTSLAWVFVLALPHLVFHGVSAVVVAIKLIGFSLHVATVFALWHAFPAQEGRWGGGARWLGALLVALHPDLVAASLSGMEIPLATLCGAALLGFARKTRPLAFGLCCALAPLVRPELALLSLLLPCLLFLGRENGNKRMALAALLGTAAGFGVMAARNLAITGRPLPATFYAKVGGRTFWAPEWVGFSELLGRIDLVDSSVLVAVLLGVAVLMLARSRAASGMASLHVGAAAFFSGVAYCTVSFFLIPPIDPGAFYHQRYVLPALPLLVGAIPILTEAVFGKLLGCASARRAQGALLALLLVSLAIDAPNRYGHYASDSRNIDDVQVALGRTLAAAKPNETLWAIDAGAARYFGSAFVVDMMGLNTPEIQRADAQRYLDAHPPSFLELVPQWSKLDPQSSKRLGGQPFRTSSAYTVTSNPVMQLHVLIHCEPSLTQGEMIVRRRRYRFRCPR